MTDADCRRIAALRAVLKTLIREREAAKRAADATVGGSAEGRRDALRTLREIEEAQREVQAALAEEEADPTTHPGPARVDASDGAGYPADGEDHV